MARVCTAASSGRCQKRRKKRPDTCDSASIRPFQSLIQFYPCSSAGYLFILPCGQGCHFLLPHDFICPADCEIPGFKKHGIQKIVLIIVQKGVASQPHQLLADVRPQIKRDSDGYDMPKGHSLRAPFPPCCPTHPKAHRKLHLCDALLIKDQLNCLTDSLRHPHF